MEGSNFCQLSLNLRDSSDVGMWAFKISEKQYQDFSNATDDERAKMLAQLIPITDDKGNKLTVVKELELPQSHAEQNLNSGYSNERIANLLKQRGLSVDSLSQEDIKNSSFQRASHWETSLFLTFREKPS